MSKDVGESSLRGDMIKMPLTDNGFAFYPVQFAMDATHKQKYSLFVSKGITANDTSILMATTKNEAQIILFGNYDKLIKLLLEIPWLEDKIKTSEGTMFRKIAPSIASLEKMIESLKNTTK